MADITIDTTILPQIPLNLAGGKGGGEPALWLRILKPRVRAYSPVGGVVLDVMPAGDPGQAGPWVAIGLGVVLVAILALAVKGAVT